MEVAEVLVRLRAARSPRNIAGMARFGIRPRTEVLGIGIPPLRALAKEIGRDHRLALRLWRSGVHEARILAAFVDDPAKVTEAQMERWVRGFDSWDLCDQVCASLFDRTALAHARALAWSGRSEEFVKRAGFSLMAVLAVHDRSLGDEEFRPFLAAIEREARDDRNYVRKAVNWALRQIGKRNARLNRQAIAAARRIRAQGTRSARFIAGDALRELGSEAVRTRLQL